MRSAGVYLIQAQIGTIRNAVIPAGDILITLRVGRSSATASLNNPHPSSQLHFGSLIQLNVDSSALETQRCSISFNGSDKRIIGIALISLPKDKTLLQNTYRLTQNQDKRAEIDIKLRIAPFEVAKTASEPKKEKEIITNSSKPNPQNIIPRIYTNGVIINQEMQSSNPQNVTNSKSKISEEMSISSQDRKTPKSFKVREEDKVVQTTESQLKRIKEQKEAYYQLYQIQKSKNEVAAKFISNLMKKVADKHPALLSIISDEGKKGTEGEKKGKVQNDSALVAQLEQANRSLHRQVEEYKRIVEQMKGDMGINSGNSLALPRDIPLNSKSSNTFLFPGIFDPVKSTLQQKSNIRPSKLTPPNPTPPPTPILPSSITSEQPEEKKGSSLANIDFKKWLDLSIGQREQIQTLLGNISQKPAESQDKNEKLLKKLKASLDKSFAALLSRKDLNRQALMTHRKEVNRCFEEAIAL